MVVCDAHCDAPSRLLQGCSLLTGGGQVTFDRLERGGVAMQVFALFDAKGRLEPILVQLERFLRELGRRPGWRLVLEGTDLQEIAAGRVRGGILALEGGDCLGKRPELLRLLHRLGLRSMMLTWNHRNRLADGAMEGRDGGVSSLGLEVIALCQELGILLDISHLGPKGVEDLLAASRGPVIASHSNCRALWDHPRNLDDDQLRAVAQRGGVVGINFYPPFLASRVDDWGPVLDHLDHAIAVMGEDHVALGSDFDGIDHFTPGLEGPEAFPALAQALGERGHGPGTVAKVMGGNLFRVYGQVFGLSGKRGL